MNPNLLLVYTVTIRLLRLRRTPALKFDWLHFLSSCFQTRSPILNFLQPHFTPFQNFS